jgi:hypothetical protein
MRHLLLLVSSLLLLQAAPKCTMAKGTGEAEVIKTNITEAKREATSRAKWDAIDKVLGTQTSVKSVTENFALLDEVITNDVQGFISDFKIINEADFGDAYQVEISGCVYPKAAEKALSVLSRDSSFTVMLLVDEKGKVKTDSLNPVNANVVKGLIEQGFSVNDFAQLGGKSPSSVAKLIQDKDFNALSSYLNSNLSGAAILGKIEVNRSTTKGADIGYGVSSVFHITTAYINYHVLAKKEGKMKIIASNTLEQKGRALNARDSEIRAMKALSKKVNADLVLQLNKYLKFKETRVMVEVSGTHSTDDNFRIKEKLQKMVWVKSVKDMGKGKFAVKYQDNSVYLANNIDKMDMLEVTKFSPINIKAKFLF